ncbi:MAG: alpha/beta hydrolase [Desulfobacteraceae bacterium]|nr:alpha/beta hydrolase [Desulfobacteraceae bacterium]
MTLEKKIIEVDGTKIYMTENPGKPLMALVRNAAGAMGIWDKIWPKLTEYFTVASIDLPVAALDEFDSSIELFRHMSDHVVNTVKGMNYDKFHIFGWTGGAQIAIRCLVDYPEMIQSAIIISAVYLPEERRPIEKNTELLKLVLDNGTLEQYTYFWLLGQHTPDYVEQHFDRIKDLVDARLESDKGRFNTARVLNFFKKFRTNAATDEELEAIRTPVLLAAPAFESFPMLSHVRRLNARIKTSEMAIIPGAGAMVLQEAPEKFMAAAGRFIRAIAKDNPPLTKLSGKKTTTLIKNQRRIDLLENPEETAIVFLHGWLMSPQMWAHAMEALQGRIRCLAFWQPGHGYTTAFPRETTMEQWADWVMETLDEMNVKNCIMVGHSMGGMVTMNAKLKYPDRIKGVVLVSTQDTVWDDEKREGFQQAVDMVAVAWGAELAQQAADLLMGENFQKSQPAWLGTWTNEVADYDLAGIANLGSTICNRPDFSGRLGEFNVPTLVVHGTMDDGIEIGVGREMTERIPGAIFREMPGAAHCPPLEVPDLFTDTLVTFLKDNKFID